MNAWFWWKPNLTNQSHVHHTNKSKNTQKKRNQNEEKKSIENNEFDPIWSDLIKSQRSLIKIKYPNLQYTNHSNGVLYILCLFVFFFSIFVFLRMCITHHNTHWLKVYRKISLDKINKNGSKTFSLRNENPLIVYCTV